MRSNHTHTAEKQGHRKTKMCVKWKAISLSLRISGQGNEIYWIRFNLVSSLRVSDGLLSIYALYLSLRSLDTAFHMINGIASDCCRHNNNSSSTQKKIHPATITTITYITAEVETERNRKYTNAECKIGRKMMRNGIWIGCVMLTRMVSVWQLIIWF